MNILYALKQHNRTGIYYLQKVLLMENKLLTKKEINDQIGNQRQHLVWNTWLLPRNISLSFRICFDNTYVAIPGILVLRGYIGYYGPLLPQPQCVGGVLWYLGFGIWGVKNFGIWDLGGKIIWDLGFGENIWDLGFEVDKS